MGVFSILLQLPWVSAATWGTDMSADQAKTYATYTQHSGGGYFWYNGALSTEMALGSHDVFTCGDACTDDTNCRSFTHCSHEEGDRCQLMNTEVDSEMSPQFARAEGNEGCYTYIPKCWIGFHVGPKHNPPNVLPSYFKASVKDFQNNGFHSLRLKPGCSVMLYSSPDFSGTQTELSIDQQNNDISPTGSFALYEHTSAWKELVSKPGVLGLVMVALATLGTCIICTVVCACCPKCAN